MVAQVLDLFSDLPLAEVRDDPEEDVTKNYKYYDISNISKSSYSGTLSYLNVHFRLSCDDVKMHWGGIRKTIFGTKALGLTKAALVFVGPRVQPFKAWHHAENAYLANFTCVLLHYPFTSSFYDKVARRYIGVEPLIDEGFLVASSDYLDWVGAQRNGQVS